MSVGEDVIEPVSPLLDKFVDIALQYQQHLPQLMTTGHQAVMNARLQHIMDRSEAMADHEYKKCNPDYVPPPTMSEDDMGTTINNGVFLGAEALEAIQNESNTGNNDNSGNTTVPPAQPFVRPTRAFST